MAFSICRGRKVGGEISIAAWSASVDAVHGLVSSHLNYVIIASITFLRRNEASGYGDESIG